MIVEPGARMGFLVAFMTIVPQPFDHRSLRISEPSTYFDERVTFLHFSKICGSLPRVPYPALDQMVCCTHSRKSSGNILDVFFAVIHLQPLSIVFFWENNLCSHLQSRGNSISQIFFYIFSRNIRCKNSWH